MEYGQSSGMVNVDGTMMPDPSKHPELEAMVSTAGTVRSCRNFCVKIESRKIFV